MSLQKTAFASVVMAFLPAFALASVTPAGIGGARQDLTTREKGFAILQVHDADFSAVSHTTARVSCEATQPPEALATPDPLLDTHATTTVSFIIGTDGRVHSPLILESLGPSGDRIVLDAVRAWRYRPAMCNGVPTEVEGKIEISSR
jgi:hypothetical protein